MLCVKEYLKCVITVIPILNLLCFHELYLKVMKYFLLNRLVKVFNHDVMIAFTKSYFCCHNSKFFGKKSGTKFLSPKFQYFGYKRLILSVFIYFHTKQGIFCRSIYSHKSLKFVSFFNMCLVKF